MNSNQAAKRQIAVLKKQRKIIAQQGYTDEVDNLNQQLTLLSNIESKAKELEFLEKQLKNLEV